MLAHGLFGIASEFIIRSSALHLSIFVHKTHMYSVHKYGSECSNLHYIQVPIKGQQGSIDDSGWQRIILDGVLTLHSLC
jgi:hypothetical protein